MPGWLGAVRKMQLLDPPPNSAQQGTQHLQRLQSHPAVRVSSAPGASRPLSPQGPLADTESSSSPQREGDLCAREAEVGHVAGQRILGALGWSLPTLPSGPRHLLALPAFKTAAKQEKIRNPSAAVASYFRPCSPNPSSEQAALPPRARPRGSWPKQTEWTSGREGRAGGEGGGQEAGTSGQLTGNSTPAQPGAGRAGEPGPRDGPRGQRDGTRRAGGGVRNRGEITQRKNGTGGRGRWWWGPGCSLRVTDPQPLRTMPGLPGSRRPSGGPQTAADAALENPHATMDAAGFGPGAGKKPPEPRDGPCLWLLTWGSHRRVRLGYR